MLFISWVNPFWRVTYFKAIFTFHSRIFFKERDADIFGNARIDGTFIDDDAACRHMFSYRLRDGSETEKVRLVLLIDRCWHASDDELSLCYLLRITGENDVF